MYHRKALGLPVSFLFFSLVFCSCSCKPVINSFSVTTHDKTEVRRMTAADTLHLNWNVKGTPSLLFHEEELPDSTGKIIELKLVVEKNGKEANRIIQVQVLPENSTTTITFTTTLKGDTLIAAGKKNPGVWGDRFEVLSVSNASHRLLTVLHNSRSAQLDSNGTSSTAFTGTPLEGNWTFYSIISPAEKADHSLLPERLQINTILTYKSR